ncbi:MAG: CDP-alcohol phosphatidyltransferase family protein [Candidatus Omnitrophica bacterium]|nr:CDP-alcohol phosphatidyltransferase family protein [Candidatus Omnitrophota bacterium]
MNIANKISTFRILTVPFFIACLLYYSPEKDYLRFIALVIFILAVFSDAVDGYIARRIKQHSPAGQILDPLGDKALLMSAFIFLYLIDTGIRFPLWVSLIVVSRDAIILVGIIAIFIVRQKLDIQPIIWGKLTTGFQMASVISVLIRCKFSYLLWSMAILFTIISGIDYIRRGFVILYGSSGNCN